MNIVLDGKDWQEWLKLLYTVIRKITAHYGNNPPDIIVPAMNGGALPGVIIAGALGVKNIRPVSIGRNDEIRFFLWPMNGDIGNVDGLRILFIEDDVRQGGRSPKFVIEHFMAIGAAEVIVACIYKYRGEASVNFFAQEVDDVPSHPWKNANPGDR